jgi:uncharacterized membrane protein YhaH (DUF805 family)
MLCSCGVNNIFGAKVCKTCGTILGSKPSAAGAVQSDTFENQPSAISNETTNQVFAPVSIQSESSVKATSSELDFIPYTSNIQFNFFIKGLRNSFDFNGRSSKSEFWYFVLFEFLILMVLSFLSTTLYAIASLILIIPATSVLVRRMHDIGKGWKKLLVVLIPFVGVVVVLYWLIQPSEANENAWGSLPSES